VETGKDRKKEKEHTRKKSIQGRREMVSEQLSSTAEIR